MNLMRRVPRPLLPLMHPKRYKGAHGGRGGAKSHFFAEQMLIECITRQARCVCIREVQNSIKDSVRQLLLDKIQSMGVSHLFEVVEHEIRGVQGTQTQGALIIFRGMQSYNADTIKSLESYKIAWVEEAQTLSAYSLELLRPTMRADDAEMWFSWNPRNKTDAVDAFFRSGGKNDDAICVQVNWRDNPWFPDALRRDMERDKVEDIDKYEHIWEGAYGGSVGAILSRWVNEADRDGRINDGVVFDKDGPVIEVSSDIGFRDTASWWYWQRRAGGNALLMYEGDSGMDADEWIPRIQQNVRLLGGDGVKVHLPHDSRVKTFQSRHSTVERFLEAFGVASVRVVPISKKTDQITAARTVIKRCEFHKTRCAMGLDGLRAWEFDYNPDTQAFSREPLHNWASHPSDAFAYGCQVMQEFVPETKAEDKPLRGLAEIPFEELWPLHRSARQESRI